jgi:hypothetical protein
MGARWISATNSFHTSLVNYSGEISFSVINLFLGGRASPYLYNGTHYHEDKDNAVNFQIQLFKCVSRYRLYKLRVLFLSSRSKESCSPSNEIPSYTVM